MKNNPKVSIIIATFNAAKTLRRALDSVENQTFQDWECIVVDGASKDDTIKIVQEFCDKDSRFRYISEPDHGIYDAFNKGWKMARGEWIHYLGADDWLTKDGMCQLLQKKLDADLVGGCVYIMRNNRDPQLQKTKENKGCHQGFITRKKIINEFKGFDERYKIIADADLLIRIKMANKAIANYDIPIAYFSLDGTSQNIKTLRHRMIERYFIYKRNNYSKYPLISSIYRYICNLLLHVRYLKIK